MESKRYGIRKSNSYKIWRNMRYRCNNKNSSNYIYYGARGIKVCKEWDSFENFYSDMGERPIGRSLDRINNDGNYCKMNCRWATPKEQTDNKRLSKRVELFKVDGKKMLLKELEQHLGGGRGFILKRIKCGWTKKDAISMPVIKNKQHLR